MARSVAREDDEQAHPATIRIPSDVWVQIQRIAAAEDRSVNYIVVRLMRTGLAIEQLAP